TAIIRANYPVEVRGLLTGKLRQWSAGIFLVSAFGTARLLDYGGSWPGIQAVLSVSVALPLAAYLPILCIRVRPDPVGGETPPPDGHPPFVDAAEALRRDTRFLTYLAGCFLFGTSALIYDPIVRAFFSQEIHLNYTQCVVLVDVLPSV